MENIFKGGLRVSYKQDADGKTERVYSPRVTDDLRAFNEGEGHGSFSIGSDIASIAFDFNGSIVYCENGMDSDGGFGVHFHDACEVFNSYALRGEKLLQRFDVSPESQVYLLDHDCPELNPDKHFESIISVNEDGSFEADPSKVFSTRTITNIPEKMRIAKLPAGRWSVYAFGVEGYASESECEFHVVIVRENFEA